MTNKFRKGWYQCKKCKNYSNPNGKFWLVVNNNLCNYCGTSNAFIEHVCREICYCKKFRDKVI